MSLVPPSYIPRDGTTSSHISLGLIDQNKPTTWVPNGALSGSGSAAGASASLFTTPTSSQMEIGNTQTIATVPGLSNQVPSADDDDMYFNQNISKAIEQLMSGLDVGNAVVRPAFTQSATLSAPAVSQPFGGTPTQQAHPASGAAYQQGVPSGQSSSSNSTNAAIAPSQVGQLPKAITPLPQFHAQQTPRTLGSQPQAHQQAFGQQPNQVLRPQASYVTQSQPMDSGNVPKVAYYAAPGVAYSQQIQQPQQVAYIQSGQTSNGQAVYQQVQMQPNHAQPNSYIAGPNGTVLISQQPQNLMTQQEMQNRAIEQQIFINQQQQQERLQSQLQQQFEAHAQSQPPLQTPQGPQQVSYNGLPFVMVHAPAAGGGYRPALLTVSQYNHYKAMYQQQLEQQQAHLVEQQRQQQQQQLQLQQLQQQRQQQMFQQQQQLQQRQLQQQLAVQQQQQQQQQYLQLQRQQAMYMAH